MIIPKIKTYFENRATATASSAQIHQLEAAAAAALASGDAVGAAAFQRAAAQLRFELLANRIAILRAGKGSTAKTKDGKPVEPKHADSRLIAQQWSALNADRVLLSKSACVLDCGTRGTATITPTGITLSGSLQTDPTALLLVARHAQLHWNGRAKAAGNDDFKFGFAVAGSMLGVATKRARIPRARRAEADGMSQTMRPILDAITGIASLRRPAAPGGSSRPGATFAPAAPASP